MKKIFDMMVHRNEKKTTTIPVGFLANNAEITIPVMVLSGKNDGPTLWLNCLVHGDELNGAVACWELFNELSTNDIKGTIVITPVSNPIAFGDRNKISSIDFLDMDTVFPGKNDGQFSQRFAHLIYNEINEHADYVINFHTLNKLFKANPYTVSKIIPNAEEEIVLKSKEMALAFGCKTNCSVNLSTASGELPGATTGALDIMCIKNNIPTFMAEIGSGGRISRKDVEFAKNGVINVMKYAGLMNGELHVVDKQYLITKRTHVHSNYGGLTTMHINPGETVSSGSIISETHFFTNDIQKTFALDKGYVIAVRENPVVNSGDRIAFLGTEWHQI